MLSYILLEKMWEIPILLVRCTPCIKHATNCETKNRSLADLLMRQPERSLGYLLCGLHDRDMLIAHSLKSVRKL